MLDLSFFRNARFSVGTASVSIAFFGLMGVTFGRTQYLQFAHGYSAIQAGAIMSSMALGLVLGAGSSSRAVARLGTTCVVAVGLSGMAGLLALPLLWDTATAALDLVVWFFAMTLVMGWAMAPATAAVVGAVPAAKSGVASATNTVARMVAGALGVAVIGVLALADRGELPPFGMHLLMGQSALQKVRNAARNIEEERTYPVQVICRKPRT